MRIQQLALQLLVGCLISYASPVVNLTGTWTLDIERSEWGDIRKPVRVVVNVAHEEPALRYLGEVLYADGETREFSFVGALDGKPYPGVRSYGEGQIQIRRLNARTIESIFTSNDRRFIETANTAISQDGKTLIRKIRVRNAEGESRWTEIYLK
jgi:hypothetical protein